MLLPALLLVGWLVWVIILMFRDDKCDKTYREGSFPEFICLHSERSSLPMCFCFLSCMVFFCFSLSFPQNK